MGASRDAVARAAELAFLGRFAGSISALPRGRETEGSSWVRAYVASSRGDFAEALELATPLAESARARWVRVAASITLASTLRQTGKHARAEIWDRAALSEAGSDVERAHALIGLAADAVGRGRTVACERRIARAAARGPAEDWRVQVRLDWVRVELALTTGRASHGLTAGRRAVTRSREAGARRHVAKSRLFYGVALADAGFLEAAQREVSAAMRGARACGARRLAQVAREVLVQKGFAAAG